MIHVPGSLLVVGIIIFFLQLFESGDKVKKKRSIKPDRRAFVSVVTLYMLINAFLTWRSAPDGGCP